MVFGVLLLRVPSIGLFPTLAMVFLSQLEMLSLNNVSRPATGDNSTAARLRQRQAGNDPLKLRGNDCWAVGMHREIIEPLERSE